MKTENYMTLSGEAMEQLSKNGAFLTTKHGENLNTMTISWASLGTIWNKPVMIVAVRYSRHTYKLIDQSNQFTVSVPALGEKKKELAFCGSKSGRDYNKFNECGLVLKDSQKISTPVIEGCQIHFECKTVYKQAMEPGLVDEGIKKTFYDSNDNYHVIYYGEIVACYKE
ncbi:MAG: flavin reductase family protein [Clostridia bacterium]|nr:flavin reductase family protein [Clostridia bacterium]